ncbi:SWIM zinc finger family protein [Verrucosispora sp. WMMA2044]|uniref:SWIM zinc finger family protein n=1 Tax=Verrucosispora sp. WMMA2044 TaxID=3016419 RepID=UPI00248D247C|nr:SWIM zinc finger family protein [Verrucosispora sp. WMMA2044]WBB49770.1 SWIM zinc finger family protein [Verrucosispora sp. WMMA2044]
MSADDGGRFADYGPPRRVDGGLRARSTRGAIGVSWWSRRFLEVLESFALGTRLTRGRSYARAGQVLRLDVAPGVVTAVVQGSRAKPYQVSVALPPFPARLWERIEQELAAQAFFSARLLAGDLPAELEELFIAAEAPLFPAAIGELDQRCSCPDVAVPCKHLAATFYLLAEAFDADPFTLLHWRGRSRADLLARLRRLRVEDQASTTPQLRDGAPVAGVDAAAARDVAGPPDLTGRRGRSRTRDTGHPDTGREADGGRPGHHQVDVPAAGALRALADLPGTPLAEAVDRFWLPPVPLPDRPPSLTARPDLLLRQLGAPAPAIGGPGLVERLRHAYRQLGE